MDQAEISEERMVYVIDLMEVYDKNKSRGIKVRRYVILA